MEGVIKRLYGGTYVDVVSGSGVVGWVMSKNSVNTLMFVVEFIFQGVEDLKYFVNLKKRKFSHKIQKEYNTI